MAPLSYQTLRLSKGKHDSPEDGACVMELASMLAEEPFTDHPESVCPVIGSFLRAYNDRIDDARRQDLYAYAAKVVGSRASEDVQYARAERLRAWAREFHGNRWLERLVPTRLRALVPTPPADLVGSHAVCAIPQHNDRTHTEVLALIDELGAIGASKQPTTQPLEKDEADARRQQSPHRDRWPLTLSVDTSEEGVKEGGQPRLWATAWARSVLSRRDPGRTGIYQPACSCSPLRSASGRSRPGED